MRASATASSTMSTTVCSDDLPGAECDGARRLQCYGQAAHSSARGMAMAEPTSRCATTASNPLGVNGL